MVCWGKKHPRISNRSNKCPVDGKSALAQIVDWHQVGDKPLPERMMTHYQQVSTDFTHWPLEDVTII